VNPVKMAILVLVLAGFAVPVLWVAAFVLYEFQVRKGKDIAAVWLLGRMRDRD
jgi:hypothetical protein